MKKIMLLHKRMQIVDKKGKFLNELISCRQNGEFITSRLRVN